MAWIEGEPGIGKSALVTAALTEAAAWGCEVYLAVGDELSRRLPLRALLDSLGPEVEADIGTAVLGSGSGGLPAGGDPVPAAVERLLSLVDQWCVAAPVVLAFDDLQWADEASLLVWHRLSHAVGQIPLLLIGACRPVPARPTTARLRRTTVEHGAVHLPLGPLPATAVVDLVGRLAGGEPGPRLRQTAAQAGGNPLYVRELVDALVRERLLRVDSGMAELVGDADPATISLVTVIAARLDFLSPEVTRALRMAALLGPDFSVYDLATVSDSPASALLPVIDEAITAGVLAEEDSRLAFRHGLIRQALYRATPASARSAMHRHAARALAEAGLPVHRVAAHLLSAPDAVDGWALDWLAERAIDLARRVPEIAVELLQAAVDRCGGDPRQERLLQGLAIALLLVNRLEDAERVARQALARASDPERAAALGWILGQTLSKAGRYTEALPVYDQALAHPRLPSVWQARLRARRAYVLTGVGRSTEAEGEARRVLADGQRLADHVTIGHALLVLYMLADYETGVGYVEQALGEIGDDPETMDLRIGLLMNRAANLDGLERSEEAEASMGEALMLAERCAAWRLPSVRAVAGWRYVERGRWDDAWTEFDPLTGGLGVWDRFVKLGGMAFIAGHRDDRAVAAEFLRAAEHLPEPTGYLLGGASHLWMARAVSAEQHGTLDRAAAVLAGTVGIKDGRELYDRYLWLPDLVRLALAIHDYDLARAAVAAAEADAADEPLPSRVAAARRARAVLDGDLACLLEVAEDYRTTGRPLALGQTREEAAVLLARTGDRAGARTLLTEAVRAYLRPGALWDIRRADGRLRQYGVRRGPRAIRRRPDTGWEALTPTEERVAALVAEGRSNPDIATEMFLSRRTVQTHVSNILAKLGYGSRIDIAREAARRSSSVN